jgi:hypothetical protein
MLTPRTRPAVSGRELLIMHELMPYVAVSESLHAAGGVFHSCRGIKYPEKKHRPLMIKQYDVDALELTSTNESVSLVKTVKMLGYIQ